MASCPDHPRELVTTTAGRHCPFCKGVFLSSGDFASAYPDAESAVQLETREDALPFKKPRSCPDCAARLAPWRIGRLEAWVERCPSCDGWWLDQADRSSLALVLRSQARKDAWASMDASERATIARDLAESEVPKPVVPVETLSAGQTVQAAIGVPVMANLEGAQRPVMTVVSLLLLLLVFVGGLFSPERLSFESLGYLPRRDTAFGAMVAVFAHAGWQHLASNLLFAWVFGDAVERKSPRWLVPVALLGMGSMSLVIDGATTDGSVVIGGASGGVFALMGLTAVLQRRGRWLMPLPLIGRLGRGSPIPALRLPLPFAMLAYAAFDTWRASLGDSGVAWVAHGAGFLIGLAGGLVLEWVNQAHSTE